MTEGKHSTKGAAVLEYPSSGREDGLSEDQKVKEWVKCGESLEYYLTHYTKYQDAVEQEVKFWEPHPHLLNLVRLVQEWFDTRPRQPRYIIIFKSKKVFTTTLLAGIATWLAMFHEETKGLEQSIGAREAKDFLDKTRFINKNYPAWMRLKQYPDQDDLLGFPALNSQILAIPSSETAGRGADSTFVFIDEWEFHRNALENYAAIQSAMARGGLLIGVSTVDKTDMESFAKRLWADAKAGKNGFIPLFWDYFTVPYRNKDTWERDTASLPRWKAEQEYPRSEEEALSPPQTLGFFDFNLLDKLMAETKEPIEQRYGGKVRIWKPPVFEKRYILSIDPSSGRDDPAAGVLGDKLEDVACFHGKLSLDEQAKFAWELYQEYNKPLMVVERNAIGLTLIEKLRNLGVTNWYYSPNDKEKTNPGFWTGPNRDVMLVQYGEELHTRQRFCPIKEAIEEHYYFALIDGKPKAVKGKHDDWVMVRAILTQGLKNMPVAAGMVMSVPYRERWR
tara:strand:- start:3508 stop:5022 length:1515 start_codon:yes stop_codon:yes gene_type:complete